MPVAATLWPLRRALSRALRDVVMTVGVPSINAYLTASMITSDPATIVQFADSSVVLGNLLNIGQATIEIDQSKEDTSRLATDTYETRLLSTIRLSIDRAGDSDPEDVKLVGDVVCDTFRDVFCQQAQSDLTPTRSDGSLYLPSGAVFQDCWLYSIEHPDRVTAEVNEITTASVWTMYHTAFITYSNTRPDALGLP